MEENKENQKQETEKEPKSFRDFAISIDAIDNESGKVLTKEEYLLGLGPAINKLGCSYWTILHDKDISDIGLPKKPHFHLVIHMTRSRRLKNAVIKCLANSLDICKDRIHCIPSYDLEKDIRYLCHLDDANKYLYSYDDVVTNDGDSFHLAWCNSLNELTFDQLIQAVKVANGSKVGVLRVVGMRAYRKNWHAINDVINEYREMKGRLYGEE